MSSDGESVNELALNEIDLDKPLVDLHSVIDDRKSLINALFEHLNKDELNKIFNYSKNEIKDDLDIERLKDLCLEQLERLSKKRILKLIDLELNGREADLDLGEEKSDEEIENKESPDDIQMNVDDEEYEEFLNAEFNNDDSEKISQSDIEQSKDLKSNHKKIKDSLSKKDQQKLINELAFPSSMNNEKLDNCKVDSDQNENGWQNLWNQTQQEINELKARAEAIKTMMQKSKSKSSSGQEIEENNQYDEIKNRLDDDSLLDNIDSDDDYVSMRSEEPDSSSDRDKSSKKNQSVTLSDNDNRKKSNEIINKEKIHKDHRHSKSRHHHREIIHSNKHQDNEKEDNEKIEDEMENEFLDIKVSIKDSNHKCVKKQESKEPKNTRMSVESGEILDDEDDNEKEYLNQIKLRKSKKLERKMRSPSFTSSIDSFGRQRRRHRSESSNFSNRSNSSDNTDFSSLDDILKEYEEEDENLGQTLKKKIESNRRHSSKHHHHHHQKSKKSHTPKLHSDSKEDEENK